MKKQDTRPPEGSTYTYRSKDPDNAYNGYTGKVVYDSDGGFSLTDGSSWLVIAERKPIKQAPNKLKADLALLALFAPIGIVGMGFCQFAGFTLFVYFFALITLIGAIALGLLFAEK